MRKYLNLMMIIKISIATLPLAFILSVVTDQIFKSILGGMSTTIGFPIPYYYDYYQTSGVEYFQPMVKYVDIVLVYIFLTIIAILLQNKHK
jgi:hypothetical protein